MRGLRIAIGVWIFLLIAVGVVLCSRDARADTNTDTDTDTEKLSAYVDWIHRDMQPKYAQSAKRLIPPLIKYAKKYNVDPLLIGCIFYWESSWRNFEGDKGEIGPGHTIPSKRLSEFNLGTLEGQIEASVYMWRLSIIKCKTLEKALTRYLSGKCVSKSEKTKKKVQYRKRYYLRINKKFKKTKQ